MSNNMGMFATIDSQSGDGDDADAARRYALARYQLARKKRTMWDDQFESWDDANVSVFARKACMKNMNKLLDTFTLSVLAQKSKEVGMENESTQKVANEPFFSLEDLWESYKKPSLYGIKVPIDMLDEIDLTNQYYVPFLSGIQLYIDPINSIRKSGVNNSESEVESQIKREDTSVNVLNMNSEMENNTLIGEPLTNSFTHQAEGNDFGLLVFQYLEDEPPHLRAPLFRKVSTLAAENPELKKYKSCDLLPTSWISVAWYPISRRPEGSTLRRTDAAFLTFHSLSTSPTNIYQPEYHALDEGDVERFSLPAFGLATYKLRGSILMPNKRNEWQHPNNLLQAAENWLQNLGVNLPDFHFFATHSSMLRE